MAASSLSPFHSFFKPVNRPSISNSQLRRRFLAVRSSLSAQPMVAGPDELVSSILSKVKGTDRGVLLSKDGHREVSDVAEKLQKYCVNEPVKCPLIFGEWDVLYCSVPTSPGGGYRSSFGRLFLNAKEMVQIVEAPNLVLNKVSFSVLGIFDGEVSLKVGLHQGSTLRLYLFALVVDAFAGHLQEDVSWCMFFAGDILLLEKTGERVQEKLELWRST